MDKNNEACDAFSLIVTHRRTRELDRAALLFRILHQSIYSGKKDETELDSRKDKLATVGTHARKKRYRVTRLVVCGTTCAR